MQANEIKQACIEARIINIARSKYKLKVWNSGNARGYNIEVSIPSEYGITIIRSKMPFDYLDSGNSFEEHVIICGQSSRKFKVITTWEDEMGTKNANEQIRDW